MVRKENENTDDVLGYVDFSTLFTSEEIKALTEKNRKIVFGNSIWGISKDNFVIYLITFCISILFISIYLLSANAEKSKILVVIMSIGASAIGAAVLACFIEHSNYVVNYKKKIEAYNNTIVNIYNQLWLIFANRSYKYLDATKPECVIMAQQIAKKFVAQYSSSITAIDTMLLNFSDMMEVSNREFYQVLKEQLVRFISDLENPLSTEHLIILLDGTKDWLRNYFSEEKLKNSMFIYEPKIN